MKTRWRRFVVGLVAAILLVVGHGGRVHAQSVQVGVVAGVTSSTFVGDSIDDATDSRTALTAGIQLVWQPAASVGFQTGLIYAGKGATFSEGGFEGFFRISYIEVPALVRLTFPVTGSALRPVVLAGAALGIRSGCTFGIESGSTSFESDCDGGELEGDLEMKSIDLGISLGLGVDVPLGTGLIISPGARFTRGLISIDDSDDNEDVRNSTLELSVAVRMRTVR